MGLIRSILRDVTTVSVWVAWIELMLSRFPGETGFLLRSRFHARRFAEAGEGLRISPGATLWGVKNLRVGRNVRIGVNNIIQANGGVVMGDDVIFGPSVKVWSVNHKTERTDIPIIRQGYEHKPVVIGNGVWIGANVFIMPGANIGDHSVISAGAVVSAKRIEPYSVLAGNPARLIASRLERKDALGALTVPTPPQT